MREVVGRLQEDLREAREALEEERATGRER